MAKVIHKALNSSNSYYVIALMSGTSLDGVDIAYIHFQKENSWNYRIVSSNTFPYNNKWVEKLRFDPQLKAVDLLQLNADYSSLLAGYIEDFITVKDIKRNEIDLISSHGHTLYHRPADGYTLQIGNEPSLHEKIGIPIVCDFRKQDVALGGQGAPLVPIGDSLLFNHFDACLNLGGFANISFIQNEKRTAFDICAVNFVLNYLSNQLGLEYDRAGKIAGKATVCLPLVQELDEIPYFVQSPPKSIGAEWVENEILPVLRKYSISTEDKLASFSEHCANQISNCINQNRLSSVLVTGGGAYNDHLMNRIQAKCTSTIQIPNASLVEFKEALIFGLMGVLKLRGEINILSSVTGASRDHSSGIIYT